MEATNKNPICPICGTEKIRNYESENIYNRSDNDEEGYKWGLESEIYLYCECENGHKFQAVGKVSYPDLEMTKLELKIKTFLLDKFAYEESELTKELMEIINTK